MAFSADRFPIRSALILGFGVTASLWAFAGLYFAHRTNDVANNAELINARYLQAQELLSTVRAQTFQASIYVRDALLDPTAGTVESYRAQIRNAYAAADLALKQYGPLMDSQLESTQVEQLRREVAEFNAMLLSVLNTDSRRWAVEAHDLLRTRIGPRRELVLRISDDVRGLNRTAFLQQQDGIAALYAQMERRVWLVFGATLIVSIGIGLVATRHASRLETRIRRQALADLEKSNDLQRLSAKLVSVQEDERRKIARDLHDDVGQTLTAIKVELARAHRVIAGINGPPQVLDDANLLADHALHTVRDMSHLIHPELLDDFGLPDAIGAYLRAFGDSSDLHTELLCNRMEQRLDPETETAVYRIVQEALTNVVKHASAANCRVYLQRLPNTLLVTIDDDGKGFDSTSRAAGSRAGLGLIGIRERVEQLQGSLRLESNLGKGTRITVELPARERRPTAVEVL
jgi:signal transduction histidine kinase